jgi:hypothetical protein
MSLHTRAILWAFYSKLAKRYDLQRAHAVRHYFNDPLTAPYLRLRPT